MRACSKLQNGAALTGDQDQAALEVKETQPYYEHLSNTFNSWNSLPEPQKQEIWHLEALRAFAREQKEHGDTHVKLQQFEQEIAYLKTQVDRLNKYQQPRELLLFPTPVTPITRQTADILSENISSSDLDYDALVSKWKSRLQSSRSAQKSLASVDLPNIPTPLMPSPQLNNGGGPSFERGPTNGDNQSYAYQDGDASDSDLMDAPGEEDEDMQDDGGDLGSVLDPKLRSQLEDAMQMVEGSGRNHDRSFGMNGNR